jgi:cellulose synthase operon protein C
VLEVRGRGAICLLCAGAWLGAGLPAAADDWSLTRQRPAQAPRRAPASADELTRYAALLRQHPGDLAALERLVALLGARDGGVAGLAQEWEQASRAAPDDALLAEAAARLLARSGQPERARALLARFVAAGDCAVGPLLLRAELSAAAGDPRAGDELLRRVVGCAQKPAERLRAGEALGRSLLAQGDLAGARVAFSALEALARGAAELRRKWPEALAQSGHPREAAEAYLELAAGDPPALLRDAALEFIQAGEFDAALSALERAARRASASQRAELSTIEEQAYRAAGRTPELARRLSEARRPEDRLRAAKLWDELGEDASAEAAYRVWLAHAPRDAEALERLARLYARTGKREQAAELYERLVAAQPAAVARLAAYAELLRGLGREREIPGLLERAARRAAGSAAVLRGLAELNARFGQAEAQKQALTRLAQLEPREPAHVVALGELLLEQGDREGALAVWRGLLSRDPARARALSTLADVLGDHDVLDEAVATMERALELEPEQLALRRKYASLLERAGKTQAAERAWQQVLARAGADAEAGREARAHLVSLWKRQGVVPIRARELAERLRAEPNDHAGLRLLAELFARDPKRAEAELALIDRLAARGQDDPEILRALAALHARRGDVGRALPLLERLAELSPEAAIDHLTRAVELALAHYRDADAERYAQRAVALRPRDAKAHRLAASLHARRDQIGQARAAYQRAAELEPRDVETWIRLAELAEVSADAQAALDAWLQVIEHAADDEQVALAARKLMAAEGAATAGRSEALLLERVRLAPQRAVYRRLLVEWYGRALTEPASAPLLARLSLRPLLDTLEDDDAALRRTAIALLAAARQPAAVLPLLAQAEKSASRAERAQALVAVGRIAAPTGASALRALLPRLPAPLRPVALWALVASLGAAAQSDCVALLSDSDAGVRAVAALSLATFSAPPPEPLLRLIEQERHPGAYAAALWALSRATTEQQRELFVEGLEAAWPIPAAALQGLRDDPGLLARALFDADARVRRAAAAHWGAPAQPSLLDTLRAPPPWPFEARAYVDARLAAAGAAHAAGAALGALAESEGQQIGSALAAALERGAPAAARALTALSEGALLPDALAQRGFCATPAFERALLRAAGPALERHALGADPGLRVRALLLLARDAGRAHPALLRALEPAADPAVKHALLRALAGRRDLPAALREQLHELFDRAPDWPTRLRVAEVVGLELGSARAEREPVALVRAAMRAPTEQGAGGFCRGRGPVN